MKLLILFLFLSSVTSCGLPRKSEVIHKEVIKDSLIYRSEIHFDTVVIQKDTFSGAVNARLLNELKEMTFRGERATTRIFYKNGVISFKTEVDSLFQLIQRINNNTEKYQFSDSKKETKTIKNKSYRIEIILVLILSIGIITFLIIKKIKS